MIVYMLSIFQINILRVLMMVRIVPTLNLGTVPGVPKKCIPFVSEYTDCTDDNECSGCSKCTCTAEGSWSCENINKCDELFRSTPVDDGDIETALLLMDNEIKRERKKKATSSKFPFVPQPTTQNSILIVQEDDYKINIADEIMDLMRPKRSVDNPKENNNNSVKFYHTMDEINEDTLKNTNESGTVKARKLNVDLPKLSRRAGVMLNDNNSNPLHIEYNKADIYQYINDNKIDASPHREDKYEIQEVMGNYSQAQKDRELSKVIVKEMKSGTETIGDKHAPVMSNVSFTPENETFVAMTYIAGNLLNKLWNMETDSSETIETEVLKHEKIAELLNLFKEPLTINQELLLKHAIEQLSTAINKNKDIKNMTLCDQLGEVREFLNRSNLGSAEKTKECGKDKTDPKEVIGNVNNVINLVKRLEDVQTHMETLKSSKDSNRNGQKIAIKGYSGLIKGAKVSDSSFGILEELTKLLLPDNGDKKLINKMKNLNIFGKDYDFNNRFKNIFNIALGNITMTTKDKIILDYLTHIENSPDCLLHGKKPKNKPRPVPSIEGNILLNLSEFFKMKSLSDLLQLAGTGKFNATKVLEKKNNGIRTSDSIPESLTSTVTGTTMTTNAPLTVTNKLLATKEKLKAHLKIILEDLMEMQNARGLSKNSDLKITDVLPCIYNILNADKPSKRDQQEPEDKLSTIFNNLQKELKYASYRRSNPVTDRPKSAIVWERLVKSLNQKRKMTRRIMDHKAPKSVSELKKMMEDREAGSNTYKNIAILADIPPADRLTLLKTLDVEVKKYITVLENIKKSLEAGIIPSNKISEFNEFVDNVANNININGKVIQKINKPKFNTVLNMDIRKRKPNKLSYSQASRPFLLPKDPVAFNTKITRDQVINQLIKNRINMYIRIKEAEGRDLSDDTNYGIAKRIQVYLDSGSYGLARELYNMFANRQENSEGPSQIYSEPIPVNTKYSGQFSILDKEPLIQFEEPKTRRINSSNQNHLLQQLINIKNMGLN